MDVKINHQTQSLINAVNHFFPGEVSVQFIGKLQAGYVRHDQSQVVQDGKNLYIQVSDLSAPNYTASHELLHVLMTLEGFPQIYFSLTSGDQKLDEQLQIMGTELFDIVCHFVVVSEQRKHDLINAEIEKMYLKGIQHTITPEPNPLDDEMSLRLMTLLDAEIFYGDHFDQVRDQLTKDYPVALQAADKLYQMLIAKPIDSPFTLRRNVVKLFRSFDEQLKSWGLPPLNNNDFTTLTSVFSKRQLSLQVRQVFEIFHSDLHDKQNQHRAYVGFNRADHQNSFTLPAPTGNTDRPDYFKGIYNETVEDLMKQLKMPYSIR